MVATNYVPPTLGRPLHPIGSDLKSSFQDASSPVLKAFTDSAITTASSIGYSNHLLHAFRGHTV